MKRFAFWIGILAVFFVSCAPFATENYGDVSLAISGDQILRKAFNDNGKAAGGRSATADDDIIYSVILSLEGSGAVRSQNATGTEAEIRSRTFSFDNVAVGATIKISCVIKRDGVVFWEGESEPTTIKAGENNINIVMVRSGTKADTLSFRYETAIVTPDGLDLKNTILVVEPSTAKLEWSSSDNRVLVDEDGIVSIAEGAEFAPGTRITITVKSGNKTASCTVYAVYDTTFTSEICADLVTEDDTELIIPYGFTTIGDGSNAVIPSDYSITNVIIPMGVTSIEKDAFYDSSLTSVEIPKSVTSIGEDAFRSCSSLTEVKILSTSVEIGTGAFQQSRALQTVTFPRTAVEIKIGNAAFFNCESLKSQGLIPEGVTTIGVQAFQGCSGTGFTSVSIPSSVTEIGMNAFSGTTNLSSVTFATKEGWSKSGSSSLDAANLNNAATNAANLSKVGSYTDDWSGGLTRTP